MNRQAVQTLKTYFGYDTFREGQALRLRFYTSTLESASYAIGIVIYETMY